MDPLSDVLSLIRPLSYEAGAFDMGGDWALSFPHSHGIKCYAVVSGQCWLSVEDGTAPRPIRGGDCFLLPQGRPFRLASDLAVAPVAYTSLPRIGGIAKGGGGGDCFIAGAHFALQQAHIGLLGNTLGTVVNLRDEADRSALRWSLDRMRQELCEQQPGAALIAQHLAHMILVQALRTAAAAPDGRVGWLFALADQRISRALTAVHGDPACRWTLTTLAEHAGMSRSGFAARFKERVGESPMAYVTRWRMLVAGDRLTRSDDPVAIVAETLGYNSETAFSTAFKRLMGTSPRRHRAENRGPPGSAKERLGATSS